MSIPRIEDETDDTDWENLPEIPVNAWTVWTGAAGKRWALSHPALRTPIILAPERPHKLTGGDLDNIAKGQAAYPRLGQELISALHTLGVPMEDAEWLVDYWEDCAGGQKDRARGIAERMGWSHA